MSISRNQTIGALAVAAALAVPGAAGAASIDTGVHAVKTHTDRADAALDRAVTLFERNADRRGKAQLNRSRKQMGLATAEAAELRRGADSASERAAAARAEAVVAGQRDQNVEQLVGVLDATGGRVEKRIARLALADTRGREKAIAVISSLLAEGVSEDAAEGLAKALAALSTDRDSEVKAESRALADRDVSRRSKASVAKAVEASVTGQAKAGDQLTQLIGDEDVPAAAKPGLQTAYDAVTAEHGTVADVLSRFSDRMPASIRAFVEAIVQQAREDAQSMRDNRPAPPSGQPDGTPTGQPDGTPTGP